MFNSQINVGGGTAVANDILSGKTAIVKGGLVTGTMPNYTGKTRDATPTQDATYTYLPIPANGYYNTSSKLRTANSNLANKSFVATLFNSANIESGYMHPLVQNYNDALVNCSGDNITLTAKKSMNITAYILVVDVFNEGHATWYYNNGVEVNIALEDRGNRAYYRRIDLSLAQNATLSFRTYLHDIVVAMISIYTT